MSDSEKLVIALIQVNNLVSLLEDNEWSIYLYSHLSPIKYELERQLANERAKKGN